MNFDSFAAKIQASAAQAAMAARSFQGFDQMAAQDEYIHSDDLNVKQSNRKKAASRESELSSIEMGIGPLHMKQAPAEAASSFRQPTENETRNDAHAKESTNRKKVQHSSNFNSEMVQERAYQVECADSSERSTHSLPSRHEHRSPPARQVTMPLLSIVRSTLTMKDPVPVGDSLSSDDHSSVASDDSLNDRDDPVLSLIKTRRPTVEETNDHGTHPDNYSNSQASSRNKKNANRFMEDLDHRISKENPIDILDIEVQAPAIASAPQTRKKGFLGEFWSTSSKSGSNNNPAPLTRERVRQEKPMEETFEVSDAANLLSDEELQSLRQFKENRKPGISLKLIQYGMDHPREAFIVFTLVAGVFVYFYTRSISAEDDVT